MIESIGNLIGGLGLLLIGMGLMTDGLKLAAGNALRDILALWTNTRKRGLLSGFLITGVVQSSSAVTVATIGFANAGMLTLDQAIWVIFGSNVGTTMTAWIVALIGFKINIEALALPLVGLGALLKLTGGRNRRASVGLALVGFGLLFLGIGFLKASFDMLGSDIALPASDSLNLLRVLLFVAIGMVLTTLMQSSSAAMVVALSAAEAGMIPLNAAAALVIGANLGTTSTALLSVFGATSTAKRVAMSHVFFNIITAIVAVLLLAPMLWLISLVQDSLNLLSSPAMSLAIFHSTFNILGVVLMWPLSNWMVGRLQRMFLTEEETESKPKYLDKNVLALPYIAVDALSLEISGIATRTINLLQKNLRAFDEADALAAEMTIIRNLSLEVGNYSARLNSTELTPYLSEAVTGLINATQHYLLVIDIVEDIANLIRESADKLEDGFSEELNNFIQAADTHLDLMTPDNDELTISSANTYEQVEHTYDGLKQSILQHTTAGQLTINDMDQLLQYANQVKRACRHIWKAARRLSSIRASLQRTPDNEIVASNVSDESNIQKLQDTVREIEEVAETG